MSVKWNFWLATYSSFWEKKKGINKFSYNTHTICGFSLSLWISSWTPNECCALTSWYPCEKVVTVLRGLSCGRVRLRAGLLLLVETTGERNSGSLQGRNILAERPSDRALEFPSLEVCSRIRMALLRSDAVAAARHWAGNHSICRSTLGQALPNQGFCSLPSSIKLGE